jgi:biotin-(acetyl-CoA carboxylase) ligase
VIDESYDEEPDFDRRVGMILDAMEQLSRKDPQEVYRKLADVLEHNHQHFHNNKWNKELLEEWYQGEILFKTSTETIIKPRI